MEQAACKARRHLSKPPSSAAMTEAADADGANMAVVGDEKGEDNVSGGDDDTDDTDGNDDDGSDRHRRLVRKSC